MVIQGDVPIYVKYKSYCDFQVTPFFVSKTNKLYAVNIFLFLTIQGKPLTLISITPMPGENNTARIDLNKNVDHCYIT